MRVSIITPMYNAADTIGAMVSSVIDQDIDDWELLVVDDRSGDDSVAIVRAIASTHPTARIRVIESAVNGGPSAARNRGLDLASGDFITFVDADDALAPGALRALLDAAAPDIDLVVGVHALRTAEGRLEPRPDPYHGRVEGIQATIASLRGSLWNFLHGKLYRRAVFAELRFPASIRRYEDLIVNTLVYARSREIVYLDQVVYVYAARADSLTWSQAPSAEIVAAPYRAVRDGLPASVVERIPTSSWTALRSFLSVMTISGGIAAGADEAALRKLAGDFRRTVPLPSLLPVLTFNPSLGAGGALMQLSFPAYRWMYRRHVRRTFEFAEKPAGAA